MAATRVALDTRIFWRDPGVRRGAFEALSRYAEPGYVELLIPDVVERERVHHAPTDRAGDRRRRTGTIDLMRLAFEKISPKKIVSFFLKHPSKTGRPEAFCAAFRDATMGACRLDAPALRPFGSPLGTGMGKD